MPDFLQLFLLVWLLTVGASIGSFVNVVVWRVPRGMSISQQGSHCPRCGHAIRLYDNIPILSWLLLRGRCRDCRTPISARYPTVELIFALMFVGYAWLAGFSDWQPWPTGRPESASVLWTTFAIHMFWLSTILTAGIIERDGQRVPMPLFVPALVMIVVAALIVPAVHPVGAGLSIAESSLLPASTSDGATTVSWLAGLVDTAAGAATGLLLVAVATAWHAPAVRAGALIAGATWGALVGWQAACWCLPLLALAELIGVLGGLLVSSSWSMLLFLTSMIFLTTWRVWTESLPAWWQSAPRYVVPAAGALTWLAAGLTRLYHRHQEKTSPLPRNNDNTAEVNEPKQAAPGLIERKDMPLSTDENLRAILDSPTYLLAEVDTDFLQRSELRPVRMQLELLKPEMVLSEEQVDSTIVVFGGTQVVPREEAEQRLQRAEADLRTSPGDQASQRELLRAQRILEKARYYDEAREFSRIVSTTCQHDGHCDYVVVTGGGPGIMEAANRGAFDVQAKSIGLNITLPHEQVPNPYITPSLCFQFHYFAMRKLHFLLRAKALVVFPGGFGTLDELFDALTLRQTRRMQEIPIVLYGTEYWQQVVDFQFLADEGVIADEHLDLISFVDNPQAAWELIVNFHASRAS